MANNRNRNMKASCAMQECFNKVFTSVGTVDFEIGMASVRNLCQHHYLNNVLCSEERHVGESHSTSCRYIKFVKVGA